MNSQEQIKDSGIIAMVITILFILALALVELWRGHSVSAYLSMVFVFLAAFNLSVYLKNKSAKMSLFTGLVFAVAAIYYTSQFLLA